MTLTGTPVLTREVVCDAASLHFGLGNSRCLRRHADDGRKRITSSFSPPSYHIQFEMPTAQNTWSRRIISAALQHRGRKNIAKRSRAFIVLRLLSPPKRSKRDAEGEHAMRRQAEQRLSPRRPFNLAHSLRSKISHESVKARPG